MADFIPPTVEQSAKIANDHSGHPAPRQAAIRLLERTHPAEVASLLHPLLTEGVKHGNDLPVMGVALEVVRRHGTATEIPLVENLISDKTIGGAAKATLQTLIARTSATLEQHGA